MVKGKVIIQTQEQQQRYTEFLQTLRRYARIPILKRFLCSGVQSIVGMDNQFMISNLDITLNFFFGSVLIILRIVSIQTAILCHTRINYRTNEKYEHYDDYKHTELYKVFSYVWFVNILARKRDDERVVIRVFNKTLILIHF